MNDLIPETSMKLLFPKFRLTKVVLDLNPFARYCKAKFWSPQWLRINELQDLFCCKNNVSYCKFS